MCYPNVFTQTFNNGDPGSINVINALAAFNNPSVNQAGRSAMNAANAGSLTASALGAVALDQACLARCNLTSSGRWPGWAA